MTPLPPLDIVCAAGRGAQLKNELSQMKQITYERQQCESEIEIKTHGGKHAMRVAHRIV